MSKFFCLLIALSALGASHAQTENRWSCSATVGVGLPVNRPSSVPVSCLVTGHYNPVPRFSIGAGTGVSFYEKALIPLFADAGFLLTRPRRVTPYLGCAAGYAFAPARDAKGGFYLNPSVGVRYALPCGMKLLFGVGYEMQRLERLKSYENDYLATQFREVLRHRSISLKVGILF